MFEMSIQEKNRCPGRFFEVKKQEFFRKMAYIQTEISKNIKNV